MCDSLNDILRPAAYQAVPLLVSILAHSGSEGAKQARGRGHAQGAGAQEGAGACKGSRGGCGRPTVCARVCLHCRPTRLLLPLPSPQAAARALSNLVCSDTTVQVRGPAAGGRGRVRVVQGMGGEGLEDACLPLLLPRRAASAGLPAALLWLLASLTGLGLPVPSPARQAIVAKSGAAAALVEACKSPGEELREAAAVALWDLAYDSTLGREAIARAGAPRAAACVCQRSWRGGGAGWGWSGLARAASQC